MKVMIVGAQCVGKTTLVDMLGKEYEQYILKKIVRNAVKANPNLKVNEDGDEETQTFLFNLYLDTLSERENYITDRGLFDVMVYTKVMYDRGCVESWDFVEEQYQRFVRFLNDNPTLQIYHIPPMFPLVEDGFRSTSWEFQNQTEQAIRWLERRLKEDENVKHFNMFTTSKMLNENRIKELTELINK
jgi:nicotinamide riboside kinase